MTRGALVRWLQGLEARELGEVLRRRPDALVAPSPGDLVQLAGRLSTRTAVTEVVATLPLPALQVIEALARLGEPPIGRARLAEALRRAPDDTELDATLRVLSQRALVWPDGDALWTSPGLLVDVSGDPEPFAPVPPAPALVPADRAEIRTAAGEAAAALLDYAAALLEGAALPDLDKPIAAHFADVVREAGLLTSATAWLEAAPPERLARLLPGWWSGAPLRRVVVRVLHDLPPDTAVHGTDSLAPLVRWTAPLPARAAAPLDRVVSGIVAEATLLGVCVMLEPDTFAISPLGRALADGRSIAEVASRLLPPPSLRVISPSAVIVADDPHLLDDVVAALDLDRLSPTVAASREAVPDALAALRAAGFRPSAEGARVSVEGTAGSPSPVPRVPSPRPSRPRPTADPADLAARLSVPLQRDASPAEQIRRRAPQLRPEQAQLLADAVEHGTPIWIRYVDAHGRASERVIENAELAGSVIEAWCRLRRDDRAFTLDKIVAVARPRH